MGSVDVAPDNHADSHEQLHADTQGGVPTAAGLQELFNANEPERPAHVPVVGSRHVCVLLIFRPALLHGLRDLIHSASEALYNHMSMRFFALVPEAEAAQICVLLGVFFSPSSHIVNN